MIFDLLFLLFLAYLSYAIYVSVILPAHKKHQEDKLISFMKKLDKE